VVDGARTDADPATTEVLGLMTTPEPDEVDVGTQPASRADLEMDSVATMRPMSTQAVFRPYFD